MQMDEAEKKMGNHLSTASLMQINEEKYGYIWDGIPVAVKKPDGRSDTKRTLIVDFQYLFDMERNYFFAIKKLKRGTVDVQNTYFPS